MHYTDEYNTVKEERNVPCDKNYVTAGDKPQKYIIKHNYQPSSSHNPNVAIIKLNKQVFGFSGFCHRLR